MTIFTDLSQYLQQVNSLNTSTATGVSNTLTAGLVGSTTGTNLTNAFTQVNASATAVTPSASSTGSATDDRVRIAYLANYSPTGGAYPGIMAPLKDTQGLMFPYTPTIQISQEVDYGNMQMTHSNTNYYYYSRSPNAQINITGKFSVQNQTEGAYAIAAIQFLRSVSKMNFGQADANAGLPPPILTLTGYGDYMFKSVRVFVKTHSYNYDENMDTVKVNLSSSGTTNATTGAGSSGTVRLPALFSLSVSLITQPTVNMMRKNFSLDDYRSGKLSSDGKGFF
jgi:hypothetical protein